MVVTAAVWCKTNDARSPGYPGGVLSKTFLLYFQHSLDWRRARDSMALNPVATVRGDGIVIPSPPSTAGGICLQ